MRVSKTTIFSNIGILSYYKSKISSNYILNNPTISLNPIINGIIETGGYHQLINATVFTVGNALSITDEGIYIYGVLTFRNPDYIN